MTLETRLDVMGEEDFCARVLLAVGAPLLAFGATVTTGIVPGAERWSA